MLENLLCPWLGTFHPSCLVFFLPLSSNQLNQLLPKLNIKLFSQGTLCFFLTLCNIFQLLIESNIINSKIDNCHLKKSQHKNPQPNKNKPSTFSTLSSANRSLHLVHSDYLPQASKTSAWYVIIILCFKNHQWACFLKIA